MEEPEVVTLKAFVVAGLRYEGGNEQGEIPALWEQFIPRLDELAPIAADNAPAGLYGVARALPGVTPGPFEYLACMPVTGAEHLPEGMVAWQVPAHTYAVVRANGVAGIRPAMDRFYREWLPNSEQWQGAGNLMMELYPPSFPHDEIIYLYLPVAPKRGRAG